MITSIDHIVLTSKDVDKTIFFYCDILGMKLEENIDEYKGKKRIYLKFGSQKINVHQEKNLSFLMLKILFLVRWIYVF